MNILFARAVAHLRKRKKNRIIENCHKHVTLILIFL